MASRPRSSSPQTEPFPPLDPAPRTPTSIHSVSAAPHSSGRDTQAFLKPYPGAYPAPTGARTSLSPKPAHQLSPRFSPRPLTGAAAMVDARRHKQQQQQQHQHQSHSQHQHHEQRRDASAKADSRQTSPNPAVSALNSLMSTPAMSRPSDAPTPNHLSEPMRKAAQHLTVPVSNSGESSQPSPVSIASFGANDHGSVSSAMTATTNGADRSLQMVAEPADMNDDPSDYLEAGHAYTAPSSANTGPKAFTYPGPMSADSREMTGSRGSPANAKRHKCPYCSTDFTRHHNLKSHLLTHSQEKPYVCQTCSARFRRLHDLKRHTKLHTGERPHTCDKCGRKFARGDALARHNKGPGGCAGRRSSFGGDDDGDDSRAGDDSMDVDYPDDDDQDGEHDDDHERRGSEPSRKRAHLETSHDSSRNVYRDHSNSHSSTYPPIAGRSLPSNMGPPTNVLPSSSSPGEMPHASPRAGGPGGSMSSHFHGAPPAMMFGGQVGMTESPKPLSPRGQDQHRLSIAEATNVRNRSPSLSQQFQQQHYGRGNGQGTPPLSGHGLAQHAPQLPSLPGLSSETVRLGHQTRLPIAPPGPSMLQHQIPPGPTSSSNPGSLSSHGRSSGGSLRDITGSSADPEIWNYIRSLEQRFSRMQDEYELRMSRMQAELISLKQHVNNHSQ